MGRGMGRGVELCRGVELLLLLLPTISQLIQVNSFVHVTPTLSIRVTDGFDAQNPMQVNAHASQLDGSADMAVNESEQIRLRHNPCIPGQNNTPSSRSCCGDGVCDVSEKLLQSCTADCDDLTPAPHDFASEQIRLLTEDIQLLRVQVQILSGLVILEPNASLRPRLSRADFGRLERVRSNHRCGVAG